MEGQMSVDGLDAAIPAMGQQMEARVDIQKLVNELCDVWPSAFVARSEATRFTGGGIATGTLANKDSRGVGPKEKYYVNGRIVYPKRVLAEWFVSQMEVC